MRVLSDKVFYAEVPVYSVVAFFPVFVPPTCAVFFDVTHFAPPLGAFWTDVLEVIQGIFLFVHKNARNRDHVQMRAFQPLLYFFFHRVYYTIFLGECRLERKLLEEESGFLYNTAMFYAGN